MYSTDFSVRRSIPSCRLVWRGGGRLIRVRFGGSVCRRRTGRLCRHRSSGRLCLEDRSIRRKSRHRLLTVSCNACFSLGSFRFAAGEDPTASARIVTACWCFFVRILARSDPCRVQAGSNEQSERVFFIDVGWRSSLGGGDGALSSSVFVWTSDGAGGLAVLQGAENGWGDGLRRKRRCRRGRCFVNHREHRIHRIHRKYAALCG